MKMRIFQKGGKCLFIALLVVLIQSAAVNAEVKYSGNIQVNKNANTIGGKVIADTDIFIIDSQRELAPKQDSQSGIAENDGSGYTRRSETAAYIIFTFENIEKPDVYILFKTGDEYAFVSGTMKAPPQLGDVTINELAWYKLDVPPAPAITEPIDCGMETAKIAGTCQGGYQYTDGNWLEIATRDDFLKDSQLINFKVTRNSGLRGLLDVDNVDLNAPVFHHLVGKLSDGVVLQPDTTYYVRVRGAIPLEAGEAGVSYGPWSEASSFNTKAAAAAAAALPADVMLEFAGDTLNTPGINSFSVPFAGPWYAKDGAGNPINLPNPADPAQSHKITNAYELVKAINQQAGREVVSTFGWWDSATQQAGGATIQGDPPDIEAGPNAAAKQTLQNKALDPKDGYQVYVIGGAGGLAINLVLSASP